MQLHAELLRELYTMPPQVRALKVRKANGVLLDYAD